MQIYARVLDSASASPLDEARWEGEKEIKNKKVHDAKVQERKNHLAN
jgi:hypothetical protein